DTLVSLAGIGFLRKGRPKSSSHVLRSDEGFSSTLLAKALPLARGEMMISPIAWAVSSTCSVSSHQITMTPLSLYCDVVMSWGTMIERQLSPCAIEDW